MVPVITSTAAKISPAEQTIETIDELELPRGCVMSHLHTASDTASALLRSGPNLDLGVCTLAFGRCSHPLEECQRHCCWQHSDLQSRHAIDDTCATAYVIKECAFLTMDGTAARTFMIWYVPSELNFSE
jgi:hypothetical protein